jgi:hypothetical protein
VNARQAEYEKDLRIPCPAGSCLAGEGKACKGLPSSPKKPMVHFGRRLKRLLAGIR